MQLLVQCASAFLRRMIYAKRRFPPLQRRHNPPNHHQDCDNVSRVLGVIDLVFGTSIIWRAYPSSRWRSVECQCQCGGRAALLIAVLRRNSRPPARTTEPYRWLNSIFLLQRRSAASWIIVPFSNYLSFSLLVASRLMASLLALHAEEKWKTTSWILIYRIQLKPYCCLDSWECGKRLFFFNSIGISMIG